MRELLGESCLSKHRIPGPVPSFLCHPNDWFWPFPAVQAMKSIRGRPTATCDPFRPFELEKQMSAFRRS